MSLLRPGKLALLAAISFSCDSNPVEPLGPGQVDGVLVSPNGAEAAAVFTLSGSGISAIEVDTGTAFVETASTTTRLVIVLQQPGDIRFRVTVAERSEPPDVTVVEVADGDNRIRDNVSSYSVVFTPVPDPVSSVKARIQ